MKRKKGTRVKGFSVLWHFVRVVKLLNISGTICQVGSNLHRLYMPTVIYNRLYVICHKA